VSLTPFIRYGSTGLEGDDKGERMASALHKAIECGVLRKIKMRKMHPFTVAPLHRPHSGFNAEVSEFTILSHLVLTLPRVLWASCRVNTQR
jgi:hypothetical protein